MSMPSKNKTSQSLDYYQALSLEFSQENFNILKEIISNSKTAEIELRERIRAYQKKISYYQDKYMEEKDSKSSNSSIDINFLRVAI
jgi:hypothetical protein